MKAAVLYGPRDVRVEEVGEPALPKGWAVIETVAVGICGTDKAFYTGSYPLFKHPLIPGHEAAGRVLSGPSELVGKLVIPEINFPCWRCSVCRAGLYTHCPSKKTLGIDFDGALAERFIAPVEVLHEAEGLNPVVATEVEPLAALLNALRQAPLRPGEEVAVIGTGNLSILLLQLLRWKGVEPVVIARPDSPKLKFVERYASEVVPTSEAGRYAVERTRDGLGFDAVFEVSGDPDALNFAIEIAKPKGTVHLKSTPGSPGRVNTTRAVVKELRIVGTRCGSFVDFREAIHLLKRGVVKPVITAVLEGLNNAPQAFERALRREEVKVVVKVSMER